jgi:hypothetical protein
LQNQLRRPTWGQRIDLELALLQLVQPKLDLLPYHHQIELVMLQRIFFQVLPRQSE